MKAVAPDTPASAPTRSTPCRASHPNRIRPPNILALHLCKCQLHACRELLHRGRASSSRSASPPSSAAPARSNRRTSRTNSSTSANCGNARASCWCEVALIPLPGWHFNGLLPCRACRYRRRAAPVGTPSQSPSRQSEIRSPAAHRSLHCRLRLPLRETDSRGRWRDTLKLLKSSPTIRPAPLSSNAMAGKSCASGTPKSSPTATAFSRPSSMRRARCETVPSPVRSMGEGGRRPDEG
jgi:hypothetical protein